MNNSSNAWYQTLSDEFIRYAVFFFLACIFISNLLWFGMDMTLPKIPLIGEGTYSYIYFYIDNLVCFIAIVLLIYGVWTRNKTESLTYGLILFSIAILMDIKRCNALFYFFICIWTIYLFHIKGFGKLKTMYLLTISALYIWSGIHKIHPFFFENSFQWMMNVLDITKPLANSIYLSHSMAAIEVLNGCLLLFNKTRKWAIILLISMHCFILVTLICAEWNLMVIPWNLFMIFSLIVCFNYKFDLKEEWKLFPIKFKGFLILISLILPAMFLIDSINPAFAYTMYSGRNIQAHLVIDSLDISKLQSPYQHKLESYYESLNLLDINYLSPDLERAPFNYSEFVFKRIFHKVTKGFNPESTALIITRYPLLSDTAVYEYVYMK